MLYSCSKDTALTTDSNPNIVEILLPESNSYKELILAAQVQYINYTEKVIEHGFIIEGSNDLEYGTKTFANQTDLKPGKVTLAIANPSQFKESYLYNYRYYVKTAADTYYSLSRDFSISKFAVDAKSGILALVGDTITIQGDFFEIESDYKLYTDSRPNEEVPYEIINTGRSIRFRVPEKYYHGVFVNFYLGKKANPNPGHIGIDPWNQTFVAQTYILGKLGAPAVYQMYYNDPLQLDGVDYTYGLAQDLKVFVGNTFLTYYPNRSLSDYISGQHGQSFKIGYTNGRDTVTFPEQLRLYVPDGKDLKIIPPNVHPETKFKVTGLNIEKYGYGITTVGGKDAFFNGNTAPYGEQELSIGNLSDGEYPVIINSNHYNFTSTAKVNVQQLKLTGISPANAVYTETLTLSGNFMEGQEYRIFFNKEELTFATCTLAGELKTNVPLANGERTDVRVAYLSARDSRYIYSANSLQFILNSSKIAQISPLSGTIGTLITIQGKGLSNHTVMFADQEISNAWGDNSTIQFIVPSFIKKGKYRIHLIGQGNILTATDYFEVL